MVAPYKLLTVLFAVLMVGSARIGAVSCSMVKGSVSCVDCSPHYDLSNIKVMVKCDKIKKLALAITKPDGSFQTELPSVTTRTTAAPSPSSCKARLLGGPNQLYALKKDIYTELVVAKETGPAAHTTRSSLTFTTSCKTYNSCGTCTRAFGSSKTVDLPIPPEFGLPPTSYYAPFFPIIGIP